MVYALAGLAITVTEVVLLFTFKGFEFTPLRTTVMTLIYAWPVVLTLWLLRGPDRSFQLLVLSVYVSLLVLLCVRATLVGTPPILVDLSLLVDLPPLPTLVDLPTFAVMVPGFAQPVTAQPTPPPTRH